MKSKTTIKILLLASLVSCTTHSNFIETPKKPLEWDDRFDSNEWREKFKRCQDLLHSDNDAWHWCMNNE